jgi:hypothetical protein
MTGPSTHTGQDRHGRSAWWYWGRGLTVFALGFGLSFIGRSADWRWLQLLALGIGAIGLGICYRGLWLAYRLRRARYWEWFNEQQARHERENETLRRRRSSSGPL